MGGFTALWAVIAAFVEQIWARPARLVVWLILIVLCAIGAVALEVVFRLDYVKVADGRLSWRFRQGDRGEKPLSAVRRIERTGNSALILFGEGKPLLIGSVWFRPGDIDRLVGALESAGPGVVDPSSHNTDPPGVFRGPTIDPR